LALAFTVSGCSASTPTVDPETFNEDVLSAYQSSDPGAKGMNCIKHDIPIESGKVISCIATQATGAKVKIAATISQVDGKSYKVTVSK
jgi:hypothetical protein